ncbi:FecCD family ABC transporter permease [Chelatococcus asaccharovorans]|uniref:Iron complex transport system permease protein n=1 Tax=Chelatococcus asaccharovorans TaxID=28210 RepID=A0A2V3UJR2_9HYPH|nr:iron ABC transporter permease [Chelatococcus asaccharovorans]MBS7706284.1 iron ABC transporter permease [Chelatococcus asaccharovorans]PXW65077.1 iron complex transport system permease protein [Chelatococcus asaccharovorans]
MIIAVVTTAAFMIIGGLLVGARPVTPQGLVSALFWPDGKIDSIIVWMLRLPRSLAAFLGGAGLSISGYLLQTLTRNPLAGPGLTGVTTGAVAAIVFCFTFVPWLSSLYYPLVGMTGGLGAALVTFWIARGSTGRPLHLALGGISVSLFLGAVTIYVLLLSGTQVQSMLFWLSGGFQGRTWIQLAYMAPWVAVGFIGALLAHRVLDLLTLSEDAAAGMGLQLKLWKPLLLLLAVLPVAGVVPVAGPVAFVGLATPHIARLLKPGGQGWTVALAAALGGLMVTVADLLARSIAAPRELPVGIITALIGGPVFIYLVQARNVTFRSGGKG